MLRSEVGNPIRPRQYQQHDWPLVGAVLTAEYFEQQYRAVVVPAQQKLMSGLQLKIESGAAAGTMIDSLSNRLQAEIMEMRPLPSPAESQPPDSMSLPHRHHMGAGQQRQRKDSGAVRFQTV